jgi:hypothetical protein
MERYISDLKQNSCQPRLVYPAKLPFLIEGEMKTLQSKEKLKEFMIIKPALQKIIKGHLHREIEIRVTQEDMKKNKTF